MKHKSCVSIDENECGISIKTSFVNLMEGSVSKYTIALQTSILEGSYKH